MIINIKKLLNKFRGKYFDIVFKVANALFIGDKCCHCGTTLKFNNTGKGKCQGLYCPACSARNAIATERVKASWSFEELDKMPGFSNELDKNGNKEDKRSANKR